MDFFTFLLNDINTIIFFQTNIELKKFILDSSNLYKLNKFKKILITVDGSPQSMKAADYAINISKTYNSELIALHVLYSKIGFAFYSETVTGLITPSSIKELVDQGKEEGRKNGLKKFEKNVMLQICRLKLKL